MNIHNIKKGDIVASDMNKDYVYYVSKVNKEKCTILAISNINFNYLILNNQLHIKYIKYILKQDKFRNHQIHDFDHSSSTLKQVPQNILIKLNTLLDGHR